MKLQRLRDAARQPRYIEHLDCGSSSYRIWIDPLAKWWHVGGSQAWHGAALSPKRLLLVVQRAASAFSGRTWRPTARERALRGTSGRPAGRACFCAGWYAIPPHPAVTSSSADAGIGRPLGIKCLTSLSTPLCRPLTTGFLLLNFHAGAIGDPSLMQRACLQALETASHHLGRCF